MIAEYLKFWWTWTWSCKEHSSLRVKNKQNLVEWYGRHGSKPNAKFLGNYPEENGTNYDVTICGCTTAKKEPRLKRLFFKNRQLCNSVRMLVTLVIQMLGCFYDCRTPFHHVLYSTTAIRCYSMAPIKVIVRNQGNRHTCFGWAYVKGVRKVI